MKLFFLLAIIVSIAVLADAKSDETAVEVEPDPTNAGDVAAALGGFGAFQSVNETANATAPSTKAPAPVTKAPVPTTAAPAPQPSNPAPGDDGSQPDPNASIALNDGHVNVDDDATTTLASEEAESTTQAATGLMLAVPVLVAIMGQYM